MLPHDTNKLLSSVSQILSSIDSAAITLPSSPKWSGEQQPENEVKKFLLVEVVHYMVIKAEKTEIYNKKMKLNAKFLREINVK